MEHKGFQIYSTPVPVLQELLGHITKWQPAGTIDYRRRDQTLVELTRFRLPSFELKDKDVAEWFGLELGRLLVDTGYRDLVIARYESEKARVQRSRSRW
jgi:hypothetical protein